MGQFFSLSGGSEVLLDLDVSVRADDAQAVAASALADKALEDYAASMQYMETYTGNDEHVRKAMANPKAEDVRREAFQKMFPNVKAIKGFYVLSRALENAVSEILRAAVREQAAVTESNAPLVTRLAKIFEGVFLFDWAKMTKPAIQNDFSFYRRELGKNANTSGIPVDDGEASAISMFVAQSAPLLYSLSTKLKELAAGRPQYCEFLADFVNTVSANAAAFKRGDKADPKAVQTFYLAAVIGIALYDRVDEIGAFARSSPIDVKKCVSAIKTWESDKRDSALSTLQYSTKTFNKAPNGVRRLFP